MTPQENILTKANIQKKTNNQIKITTTVYILLVQIILIVGFIVGSESNFLSKTIGWFDISFYHYSVASGYYSPYSGLWIDTSGSHIYHEEIIAVTLIYLALLSIPTLIEVIQKRQRQNTSLTISESTVNGSYDFFLFKKNFKMPIEKVDSIAISSNFADEIRTGKTIDLRSASGTIKLHFVQNAEEVVTTAMDIINQLKEKAPTDRVVSLPAVSESDKIDALKKYKELKDQGIITEEEFEAKKNQLLN